MRRRRSFDHDHIVGTNNPAFTHDRHDAGFAEQLTIRAAAQNGSEQPALETLYLDTRIAQACHLQHYSTPNPKQTASRKTEEADAASSNVLAHVTRRDLEASLAEFFEKFRVNQMDLPEVRL